MIKQCNNCEYMALLKYVSSWYLAGIFVNGYVKLLASYSYVPKCVSFNAAYFGIAWWYILNIISQYLLSTDLLKL